MTEDQETEVDAKELIRRLDKTLADLKRERDELRVKAHLARMEASDEWKEIESKLVHLESRLKELARETDHAVISAASTAATTFAEDIRIGLKNFSKGL